jgi:hypothetical protein
MGNDMTTDDRLRELYERALASDVAGTAGSAHPTPEEILALVRREGPESERLARLDHVMSCRSCRESFELIRSIEAAGAKTERTRLRRILPLALAATIVLAIGVAIFQRADVLQGPDVLRGGADAVTLLAPPTDVETTQPLTFAWRPVTGALRYDLDVLDAEGGVIFSTTTTDTVVASPALPLAAGAEYRWLVRATTAGGEVTSPTRPLRPRR